MFEPIVYEYWTCKPCRMSSLFPNDDSEKKCPGCGSNHFVKSLLTPEQMKAEDERQRAELQAMQESKKCP